MPPVSRTWAHAAQMVMHLETCHAVKIRRRRSSCPQTCRAGSPADIEAVQCMTAKTKVDQAHEYQDWIESTVQMHMLLMPCSQPAADVMEVLGYLVAPRSAGGGALAGQPGGRHRALLRAQRRALEVRGPPALRQQPPAAHVHARGLLLRGVAVALAAVCRRCRIVLIAGRLVCIICVTHPSLKRGSPKTG